MGPRGLVGGPWIGYHGNFSSQKAHWPSSSGAVVVVGGNASAAVGGEVFNVVGGLVDSETPAVGRVIPGFGVGRYAQSGPSAGTVVAIAS